MTHPAPIPFDTHRFVKRLTDEGMPAGQAEALADEQISLLNSNLVTKQDISHLATKKEVAAINEAVARCATKEEVAAINGAVARCATKEEVAAINGAVARCATKEEVAAINGAMARCATKEEVAAINGAVARCATKEEVAALERRLDSVAQDVAVLKSDVRTLKWVIVGVGFGMLTVMVGVSSLVFQMFWTV